MPANVFCVFCDGFFKNTVLCNEFLSLGTAAIYQANGPLNGNVDTHPDHSSTVMHQYITTYIHFTLLIQHHWSLLWSIRKYCEKSMAFNVVINLLSVECYDSDDIFVSVRLRETDKMTQAVCLLIAEV